ncbi:MAG TPA: GNAT family N-acetyltransferase [Micromonosporaceae bacterium]|nr:GNAT family N-acetyltransferase [Micromonosporaceae bacterium]
MVTVRRFRDDDAPTLWALNALPNIGATADPATPLPLPPAAAPPPNFPDLGDVPGRFAACGGDFLVAELDGHLVGMGGIRPTGDGTAEVVRVRVHPATRRCGVGRALMDALEARAAELGITELHLDTATNQPEAMAFYASLGYREVGREHQPGWTWTLAYFRKHVST